ncbi:MAG: transglutaminase family protein, partial [Chitinophagales bacterium]
SVTKHFQNWLQNKEYDLLQVMILIARYQYRDLNEAWILENVDEIVNSIDFEISRYNPPLESVSIINRFLYDTYEFTTVANKENAVKHFALNNVLSLKKGVSSSIAILYLIIASKLDVPISGIVLDNNLILGYFKRPGSIKKANPKLYFYINPQEKGAIVTNNSLNDYLVKRNIAFQPNFNRPSCNMRIMRLVLSHLVNTYQSAGQDTKKEEIDAWIEDLDNRLENSGDFK